MYIKLAYVNFGIQFLRTMRSGGIKVTNMMLWFRFSDFTTPAKKADTPPLAPPDKSLLLDFSRQN
jgi:hypothetical protein